MSSFLAIPLLLRPQGEGIKKVDYEHVLVLPVMRSLTEEEKSFVEGKEPADFLGKLERVPCDFGWMYISMPESERKSNGFEQELLEDLPKRIGQDGSLDFKSLPMKTRQELLQAMFGHSDVQSSPTPATYVRARYDYDFQLGGALFRVVSEGKQPTITREMRANWQVMQKTQSSQKTPAAPPVTKLPATERTFPGISVLLRSNRKRDRMDRNSIIKSATIAYLAYDEAKILKRREKADNFFESLQPGKGVVAIDGKQVPRVIADKLAAQLRTRFPEQYADEASAREAIKNAKITSSQKSLSVVFPMLDTNTGMNVNGAYLFYSRLSP